MTSYIIFIKIRLKTILRANKHITASVMKFDGSGTKKRGEKSENSKQIQVYKKYDNISIPFNCNV